jgi:hypothetical protein
VVDKPVRHIWFWLPGNIAFYALVDGGPPGTTEFLGTKLLSMVSYKFARNHPVRGVFISLLKDDDPRMPENLRGLNYELVREYPSIPLYFYRLE